MRDMQIVLQRFNRGQGIAAEESISLCSYLRELNAKRKRLDNVLAGISIALAISVIIYDAIST